MKILKKYWRNTLHLSLLFSLILFSNGLFSQNLSGEYRLRVKATNQTWHCNGTDDKLISTRYQTDDDYSIFILEKQQDNSYRIKVKGDSRYLHYDGWGDKLLSSRYVENDDFTRFIFEAQSDGSYRIKSKANNQYFSCNSAGDKLVSSKNQANDGNSRFVLETTQESLSGAYRLRVKATNQTWHCNGTDDKLISTRYQTDDDYSVFILEEQQDNSFRIKVKADNRYLHYDGWGDKLLSTRAEENDDFTRFIFEAQGDGSYRIKSKANNQYFSCNSGGDKLISTNNQANDGNSRFVLERPTKKQNPIVVDPPVTVDPPITVDPPNPIDPPVPPATKLTANQLKIMKEVMGKGYEAHRTYADLESTTEPLFDYDKLQLPDNIQVQKVGSFKSVMIEGNSLKAYSNSLSASASVEGGIGLFSAGVSTSFGNSSSHESEQSFFTWNRRMGEYRMDILNPDACLKESVKSDINNMNPEELFIKYGTHYIKSALIGARIEFRTTIDRSKFSNSNDFGLEVKAAYGAISGEAGFETKNAEMNEEFRRNASVEVFGGEYSLGAKIENDKNNMEYYEEWRKTYKNNMTLADFANNGLRPIWELATTQARKNQLKAATAVYLSKYGTELPEPPKPKKVLKRNSSFVLRTGDNRYVSRPMFKWVAVIGDLYHPIVVNSKRNGNNKRIVGLFSFNNSPSDIKLTHGSTVPITFVENVLLRVIDPYEKELNKYAINRRFLKTNGSDAHYWDYDASADWTIQKVGGKYGDTIFNNDKVYFYHPSTEKYLTTYISGETGLSVEEKNGMEQNVPRKFIWRIEIVK